MAKSNKTIILGVTASIAIYKACEIIRALRKSGLEVKVVMTQEAEELIKPIVFQSLSGNRVYRAGLFLENDVWDIAHVSLASQANLILVAPATANIIAKLASGICDDLLTCTVCASQAQVIIAPAMNENMWNNKITQNNVQKLKTFGYKFILPQTGLLACGATGVGCLAQTENIIKVVKNNL